MSLLFSIITLNYYNPTVDTNLYKKAYFLSRRGLNELDQILIPFVENKFLDLKIQDKSSFLSLLENEDVDLLEWILYGKTVPKQYLDILNKIVSNNK